MLNAPLVWADEVAILSLVWITFIGASMGVKTQSSAAITFLVDRLSSTSRKIVITIGNVFTLIFIGTIIYLCFQWLSSPNIAVQKTDTLELPMIYGYISVPIGFICMFIHLISITLSVSEEDRGVNA